MSRWVERTTFALLAAAVSAGVLAAQPAPKPFGFGRAPTSAEIAAWDIDVRPDGKGLPKGRGTVAQGQRIYEDKCASCHGMFGESVDYLRLTGGVGTLKSGTPVRTTISKLNYATTLFDYIRRAMPFTAPQSLTPDEVYAVTAYVLNLGDVLADDAALDEKSILAVRMPNRDGFTTQHGFMRKDGKPDVRAKACMDRCNEQLRITSSLPEYAKTAHGDLANQQRLVSGLRAGGATAAATAPAPPRTASAQIGADGLAQRNGCTACHAVDHRVVGPSFEEVAAKYKQDGGALERLTAKVRTGGAGNWGNIPMPAQAQIDEGDLRTVIKWILERGKS